MGKSSTHAVVPAQLISKGQEHGIHLFIVQLRDLGTLEPLPGTVYAALCFMYSFLLSNQDIHSLEPLPATASRRSICYTYSCSV